jgi:S-DNA-T family DNA segregation ATPase FtsK/SpoIIIE
MNVRLKIIQGKPVGKEVILAPGPCYFGRGPECQIRFNSDWVSRQHCVLTIAADGASIRDLGSRNGTLVNGALVKGELALKTGDQVQVGPVVFEVTLTETEADGPFGFGSTPDGGQPNSSDTGSLPPEETGA